jgi:isopentenyl-diphosphate delta-isomerase
MLSMEMRHVRWDDVVRKEVKDLSIGNRKDDHIDICLNENVRTTYNHWNDVHLVHQAIPVRDLDDIDLRCDILGKSLKAPLIIAAMTGGSNKAEEFNRLLAKAAEEFGIGLGVGSQRAGIENEKHITSYSVVKEYEIPLLLGNLGAPQFAHGRNDKIRQYGIGEVEKAMEMIGADAVCIHLNYLQEVVQPEGDTHVGGLIENISGISGKIKLVCKETGAGISRETALKVKEAGMAAIDVGGSSGTSFSAVESFRSRDDNGKAQRFGTTYWDWGIPTPLSIRLAQVGLPIIATGGLRNGLDVVKALALGADIGGMAWPLLVPASKGYDDLKREIELIIDEIRIGLFLSGACGAASRGDMKALLTGRTRDMMEDLRN